MKFLLASNQEHLVRLGCDEHEIKAAQETSERETQHVQHQRVLTIRRNTIALLKAKKDALTHRVDRLKRLQTLLATVLGVTADAPGGPAVEDGEDWRKDGEGEVGHLRQAADDSVKAKVVDAGCWQQDQPERAGSKRGRRSAVGGGKVVTREALARAVVRHMRSVKAQLRRYESHTGPLVKLQELSAFKLNGAFLKVEIVSAVLSKDNIPNPFAELTAGAGEDDDSDEGGGAGGGTRL